MLHISTIKIEGLAKGCVTDNCRPKISFSLASDLAGEALQNATISIGDWKLETKDQINNHYDGPLTAFTEYEVRVTAIGVSGETANAVAHFQTGRLDTPWRAKWITDGSYDFPKKTSPAPMTFRTSFSAKGKVKYARINATALGVYELLLDGKKIGEDYFAPGFTSYEHQIQYQTYDVSGLLEKENTLTAVVAGGWAAGSFNYIRKNKISADRQALLLELFIEYFDGTSEMIVTDESWQVTEDGSYRMAEWYDGETFDATIDLDKISWKKASVTTPRGNPALLAQYGDLVRVRQVMEPVYCGIADSGDHIYDFGQNFAGVVSAKINGKKGQQVIFRHAEVLVGAELFVKSLRTAKATATYICIDGEQSYSPRLTYMGFRYVGIQGIAPENIQLAALVLNSSFEETGSFSCSNNLLNRLNENIRWGGFSNFVDIPTDCPQRDERQGWTGDIAVFASTACYNFNMERFFGKWLLDLKSEQSKGGGIPMVVPRGGDKWPIMATSCWGDSCVLVPWAEYMARGDRSILERQYPVIQKFLKAAKWWAAFLSFTPAQRYIWRWPFHFGDWCAPGETAKQWLGKGKWVGTAYFANSCGLAAKIAQLLGKADEAAYYSSLREKIILSYRNIFTDKKGKLNKEFQTAYVLPLYFGMTEGDETAAMADKLAQLVRNAGNHLTTGFTGTPYILFALADNGYTDVAFDLLFQDTCPSWLYEVKTGGTTIWERWDALRPDGTVNIDDLTSNKGKEESDGGMVSFNHYANGAVGDFLYRRIAGIEATIGGYKTFSIAPLIGGGITSARGSVLTPYGTIVSEWIIENGEFRLHVEVPVSTECTISLPDGQEHNMGSGKSEFSCKLER